MTKIDKEIQEAMYDPKAKKGKKPKINIDNKYTLYQPLAGRFVIEEKINPANFYKELDLGLSRFPPNLTKKQFDELIEYRSTDISTDELKNFKFYDPKAKKGKLVISGKKKSMQRLKKHLEKEHPSTKGKMKLNDPKPKAKPSKWFDAMVKGIKRSSDVKNPYAIVKRIWANLSIEKKRNILKREASGEVFKYNLPLPDDRETKGIGTLRMVKPFNLVEAQVNLSTKDMEAVKKSGIFSPMKREDGSTCMVARCKGKNPVNVFVDELR